MQANENRPANPRSNSVNLPLKEIVIEASQALARLDANRLEELALCCQALNKDLSQDKTGKRQQLAGQAREAAGDMAIFARVLEVTRENLQVLNRLRELRGGPLEYSERQIRSGAKAGNGYGNH